ncbi:RrF2 family transcriptional regulator [Paenibacillus jiagnxiensis]|uniref:RrF2 family transcriptional regulator n=1 Tax=Paenibacillus jiagnxiensis TaxID=3228926 RepID=UPI0033B34CB7
MSVRHSIKIGPPRFGIAVHALICLAQSGKAMSSAAIAKKVNSHATFVRRVLIQLVQTGIVEAKEGRDGGYILQRDPDQITLADIFLALNSAYGESDNNNDCTANRKQQDESMEDCCVSEEQINSDPGLKELETRLHSIMDDIQIQTIMLLKQHTLAEVMKDLQFNQ